MIKDKASFYIQLSKLESLKDNLLSIIFSKHPDLDISHRESYFDKISPFYKRYTLADREFISEITTTEKKELAEWEGLDLRIEKMKIQSVRGLPSQMDSIPFGIDFTKNQEPQSMVILGANAFGKSSIYNALEFSFCQRIGEAQLRTSQEHNDGADYFKDYLRHFEIPFANSICNIELKCKKVFKISEENMPESIRKKINPNSHFISDYDIYRNGKLNFRENARDSFQNLIAKSIGLSELLEKEKELFAFAGYGRKIESNRVTNLEREIKNSEELIERNKIVIQEKTKSLQQLEQGQKPIDQAPKVQETLQLILQFKESKSEFNFNLDNLLLAAKQFSQVYDEFVAISEKTKGINQLQFLTEGLKYLHEEQSCPICNNSKLNNEEIKEHLEVKIYQLEQFNKLSAELKRTANYFIEMLSDLRSKVVSLRGGVTYDISLMNEKEDFNEFLILTNEYLSYLNNLYAQDIFSKIPTVDDDRITINVKLNHLKEIVNNYSAFLINDLRSYEETIKKYIDERKAIIEEVERKVKSKLQVNSKEGELALLKKDIQNLQSQILTEQKSINVKRPELKDAIEVFELYTKIKSETREYANEFHRELAKEIKGAFEPIQKIVKEVLDEYLYLENRPATLKFEMKPETWDEETGEVISEIITAYIQPLNESYPAQDVNKYFNTFHYRLFCTMVGISIAIASRKNTGINLPLVLDDIFYASDFENRATIEGFIKKMFSIFKQFTPKLELQLILFTHDQLIFESIIKASKTDNIENILFAKLFKHEEAELDGDFKNLVLRMPAFIPYSFSKLKI